ncbi:MAG TPA: hypothetical protein VLZ84_04960 [Asticcacaulis sp.]|nr:hypothetical protein [Asticcacaulis sp.]
MTARNSTWLGACLLGAVIVVVFGAACLYAASHGGPGWMAGRELSIFLKLSAVTAAAVVVDILWTRIPPTAEVKVDGGPVTKTTQH